MYAEARAIQSVVRHVSGNDKAIRVRHHFEQLLAARILRQSMGLRFFWNGIRVPGLPGLTKGFFSFHQDSLGSPFVSFTADGYEGVPLAVRRAFMVENGTDTQSDHFETDSFDICPLNLHFHAALRAVLASREHFRKVQAKRQAKDTRVSWYKLPEDGEEAIIAALLARPATVAMAAGA